MVIYDTFNVFNNPSPAPPRQGGLSLLPEINFSINDKQGCIGDISLELDVLALIGRLICGDTTS